MLPDDKDNDKDVCGVVFVSENNKSELELSCISCCGEAKEVAEEKEEKEGGGGD